MSQIDPAETFRNEVSDLLDGLEQSLLDLEKRPADQELIDSAFRALHTIKGSGAMFGFEQVAGFTHEFETLFDRIRKGDARMSAEVVHISLDAKDHIRTLVDRPESVNTAAGESILARLHAVTGGGASSAPVKTAAAAPAATSAATWLIRMQFKPNVLVNGTNPLLLLDELRGLGQCEVEADTSAIPLLKDLDPEACYISWTVRLTTDAAALQTQMAGALAAFEASGAKLESALAMLTAGGEKVRAILKAALACLAQQDNLETRLDAACKALREAGSRGGTAADTPLVKARAAEYFSKRYTMSAERHIHHGKAGGKASTAPAADAAEADLESIFF